MQIYFNGRFMPRREATLDLEERAANFADGVYEVVRYFNGQPFQMQAHLDRLRDSCAAIDLPWTDAVARLDAASDELVHCNNLANATVYWQVSRGVAPRKHAYAADMTPTVYALASPAPALAPDAQVKAVKVLTQPDTRWTECWIKSLMLLPNVLAKTAAVRAGCDEAVFVRDGHITEGTSTSVMVVRDGVLWSHPLDGRVLPSVTLRWIKDAATRLGIPLHDAAYPLAELPGAQEMMILGTTTLVAAVIGIDGVTVGDASAGPITTRLHAMLRDASLRAT